jgi:hypothetical protein
MNYFNFKKRAPKQSDNSKLIVKVDREFSDVVRLTAADERGMCECITCGNKKHWLEMECGHFVKRRHMATRYDLQNCGPQCTTCNCHNDGREEDHANYIDRTYGAGTADKLRRKAEEEKKWMPYELESMHQELRTEAKALRQEKLGLN